MGWLEDKLTGEERLTGAACAGWRVGDRWTGSWRGDNNIDLAASRVITGTSAGRPLKLVAGWEWELPLGDVGIDRLVLPPLGDRRSGEVLRECCPGKLDKLA